MRGIRGARWLLGENRTTSAVVVFLEEDISAVVFEGGYRMRRNLVVDTGVREKQNTEEGSRPKTWD